MLLTAGSTQGPGHSPPAPTCAAPHQAVMSCWIKLCSAAAPSSTLEVECAAGGGAAGHDPPHACHAAQHSLLSEHCPKCDASNGTVLCVQQIASVADPAAAHNLEAGPSRARQQHHSNHLPVATPRDAWCSHVSHTKGLALATLCIREEGPAKRQGDEQLKVASRPPKHGSSRHVLIR